MTVVPAPVTGVFGRDKYTICLYTMLANFGFKQPVLGSVTPFLRDEMGLSTFQIGWYFSIYAIGLILSARFFKMLAESMAFAKVLRVSATAMVVSIMLLALPAQLWAILAVALLLGVFIGPLAIGYATGFDLGWRMALVPPAIFLALAQVGLGITARENGGMVTQDSTDATGKRLPLSVILILGMVLLGIATEWGIGFWGAGSLRRSTVWNPVKPSQ